MYMDNYERNRFVGREYARIGMNCVQMAEMNRETEDRIRYYVFIDYIAKV